MSIPSSSIKQQWEEKGILSPDHPTCPYRNIICRFGDKWSLLILYVLNNAEAPLRFSALERSIPDISSRVLSSCLRDLEADDLIQRKLYAEVPPKVEYSLTPLGRSLMPHLLSLTSWALENFNHIVEHRAQYKHATHTS
jgi:DNA-binding HxlR family transcriptional regulator